jgi:hypothetical protein
MVTVSPQTSAVDVLKLTTTFRFWAALARSAAATVSVVPVTAPPMAAK